MAGSLGLGPGRRGNCAETAMPPVTKGGKSCLGGALACGPAYGR
jgi:hypothetical protein